MLDSYIHETLDFKIVYSVQRENEESLPCHHCQYHPSGTAKKKISYHNIVNKLQIS